MRHTVALLVLVFTGCSDTLGPDQLELVITRPNTFGPGVAITPTATFRNNALELAGRIGTANPCFDFAVAGTVDNSTVDVVLTAKPQSTSCVQQLAAFDYLIRVKAGHPTATVRLTYNGGWPDTTFTLTPT
jgi:hypothetical protein